MPAEERTLGEMLIQAAKEMVAVHRGEMQPARVDYVVVTKRQSDVEPPPHYTAKRIKKVRANMGVSQTVFAKLLGVSVSTVKSWEQILREPDGPTRRLLQVAEEHPEILLTKLTGRRAEEETDQARRKPMRKAS